MWYHFTYPALLTTQAPLLTTGTLKSQYDAIIDASLARLRPILITTLTTVLGLLPLIISQDPLFYGMASAIAFGLAVGTVLTLCVVPALYAVLYRVQAAS